MCTCTSCEYTDGFSNAGFTSWPSGEPKGKRASAAEYAAHVAHLWEGVPRTVQQFKPGQPPRVNIPGLVHPVQPAPKYVLDFIASGYAMRPDLWKRVNGRWEPVNIPTLKPKRVSSLLALARELRKAA